MSRLIDADALWKDITTRIEEYCDIADLIDIIERQPTIEPEQHWIPVTERLPKRSGYYLVTRRTGTVNKCLYQDGYWYGNWTVTAWMPLPEPYKEGEADEAD